MRENCEPETVKFRDRHGKPVSFKRIPAGCPKPRRRPETRHLRPYQFKKKSLGDDSCSHTSRVVRGGVGALVGGVLGSMIGGGIALAVTTTQADITAPIETFKRGKTMILVAAGVTILGAVGGLAVGSAKPEC